MIIIIDSGGNEVPVNPDHIVMVTQLGPYSVVHTTVDMFESRESPIAIMDKINENKLRR